MHSCCLLKVNKNTMHRYRVTSFLLLLVSLLCDLSIQFINGLVLSMTWLCWKRDDFGRYNDHICSAIIRHYLHQHQHRRRFWLFLCVFIETCHDFNSDSWGITPFVVMEKFFDANSSYSVWLERETPKHRQQGKQSIFGGSGDTRSKFIMTARWKILRRLLPPYYTDIKQGWSVHWSVLPVCITSNWVLMTRFLYNAE